ncbi:uncharacterized protein LOC132751729 [Ruditapes philippinarum]|uniref:uncharacterized protein LOC132751729 n=1 Tax=Ruditapes philippinarum TaxID=129788 RepID=UPI00295BDFB0|nr:uncharacterized protein LOC132751729 [Ruditapes philippinarum]
MKKYLNKTRKIEPKSLYTFYVKIGWTEQNQHQTTSISRETELNVASHLPNTYEQLQSRADTENNLAYDSLHANTSAAQDSHSQYESLKQEAGTSHTYAGLEYNR